MSYGPEAEVWVEAGSSPHPCGDFEQLMTALSEFQQYYNLADKLIENATKEKLAECARLLALNLAHYRARFGELPLDVTLAMLNATQPNEKQAALLRDSMEILVGVLGGVLSGLGQETHKKYICSPGSTKQPI